MSKKIDFNFPIASYDFSNRDTHDPDLLISVLFPDFIWISSDPGNMADNFYQEIDDELLSNGNYLEFFRIMNAQTFKKDSVLIKLKKRKLDNDRVTLQYPDLQFEFDFFYSSNSTTNLTGYFPQLGIEATGKTIEGLKINMKNAIQIEFIRKERLPYVNMILEGIWFENVKLKNRKLKFEVYTFDELANIRKIKKKSMIPLATNDIRGNSLDNVYERDKELNLLENILFGKYRSSVLLIGPSGIGKSALFYNFVKLANNKIKINKLKFRETTASELINKLMDGQGWQKNLSDLCKELGEEETLLYINNFKILFEVGQYEGNSVSIGQYIKDYIARGEINIITECTDEELSKIELLSPGYSKLFHKIIIKPLSKKRTKNIIDRKVGDIKKKYKLEITEEAVNEIDYLHNRYNPYSGLPGKTIRFIESITIYLEKKKIEKQDVIDKFCEESGIPQFILDQSIPFEQKKTGQFFRDKIFGQKEVIKEITNLLMITKAALTRENTPIASLLFTGPTGVGKTEMVKVMAEFIFGSKKRMIRFDMSEYSDPVSVLKLTGESFSQDGLLTNAIRENPFTVVLFDEIEKADPSFFDILLQITGEGRLTDSKGKTLDFCSSVIIMTSNIGGGTYKTGKTGFTETLDIGTESKSHFIKEVQKFFKPELYNRIRVIPFYPLKKEIIEKIAERELMLLFKREGILSRKGSIYLENKNEILSFLIKQGFNIKYGAREMQRTIQREVAIPLSKELNRYREKQLLDVRISVINNTLKIDAAPVKTDKKEEQKKNNIEEKLEMLIKIRRESAKVENGEYLMDVYYQIINFENEMKIKEKREALFKDMERVNQYKNNKDIQKRCFDTFEEIKSIEEIMMSERILKGDISEESETLLSEWINKYEKLKLDIYLLFNSKQPVIFIRMIGISGFLDTTADIYKSIAEQREYKTELREIRLNYGGKVYENPEKGIKLLGDDPLNTVQRVYSIKKNNTTKDMANDDPLLAYEMKISGALADIYFNDEKGIHKFMMADGKNEKILIEIIEDEIKLFSVPINQILRKNFLSWEKSRRTYNKKDLKDTIYKITTSSKDYTNDLVNYLDGRISGLILKTIVKGNDD